MAVELRTPTEADVGDLFRVDGRAFGAVFTSAELAMRRPSLELDRFRMAVDAGRIVGCAGAYTLELTMPGGSSLRAAGVTWVATQSTHRRQGIMTRLLDALHADARDRDEPVAVLTASESAIYERFGYGVASHVRIASIATHQARLRADAPGSGDVWFGENLKEVRTHVVPRYDKYRRVTTGEISRNERLWDVILAAGSQPRGAFTPMFWLLHRDGYAAYRVQDRWNDGQPAHRIDLVELVALTDAARGALWRTLLSTDLVGEITTRVLPLDDPLPYWLEHPRAVRTSAYNDWMWVKPLDPVALLGARTYGTADRLVVEIGARRWSLDATGAEVALSRVRTRPDITVDESALGAISLGAVRPSTLARAGRLGARDVTALRRADAFFACDRLASSQTPF